MTAGTVKKAPFLLRVGRATRHLPRFRGLSSLLRVYRRVITDDVLFRVKDFDGDLKLDVNIRETLGVNIWHAPRLYERLERKLFCSSVGVGSTVLDVGANIGLYTLLAAKRGARVFAIEPDPDNAQALRQHIEMNGFSDRVTVIEMAALDRRQSVILHRNAANSGGSSLFAEGEAVTVAADTIDSLELPVIDVCKMDIEGSEFVALLGMKHTIERSPQLKLLIECSREFVDNQRLLDLLHAQFTSVRVVGGRVLTASDKSPRYCNLWASR